MYRWEWEDSCFSLASELWIMEGGGEEKARRESFGSSQEFEFEFNSVAVCQTQLISADELFVDGVLLPLRLLSPKIQNQNKNQNQVLTTTASDTSPAAIFSAPVSSKRWTDVFRLGSVDKEKEEPKKKKKKMKTKAKKKKKLAGAIPARVSTAEQLNININIWPFSRSMSVRNNKPRSENLSIRKVRSAPCSRRNPGGGIHVGRQSPVRQKASKNNTTGRTHRKKNLVANTGSKFLKLNVNNCRGESSMTTNAPTARGTAGGGGGHYFNLRSFFFPKV